MNTLFDVYLLKSKLYHWIDGDFYNVAVENYLEIDSAKIIYSEDNSKLESVEFTINWGRYYADEDKKYLNEYHITIINIEKQFLENYDYILGRFTEKVESNN